MGLTKIDGSTYRAILHVKKPPTNWVIYVCVYICLEYKFRFSSNISHKSCLDFNFLSFVWENLNFFFANLRFISLFLFLEKFTKSFNFCGSNLSIFHPLLMLHISLLLLFLLLVMFATSFFCSIIAIKIGAELQFGYLRSSASNFTEVWIFFFRLILPLCCGLFVALGIIIFCCLNNQIYQYTIMLSFALDNGSDTIDNVGDTYWHLLLVLSFAHEDFQLPNQ
jgi:hypothetical protein